MPYPIVTKDGITVEGIPDDVPKDAQGLKDQVAQLRASGKKHGVYGGGTSGATTDQTPQTQPGLLDQPLPQFDQQTQNLLGRVNPGLAFALGGEQPSTMAGLGGAVARGNPVTGTIGLVEDIGNPIVKALGGKPMEHIQDTLTSWGVPDAKSNAEKLVQFISGFIPMGAASKGPATPTEAIKPESFTDVVKKGSASVGGGSARNKAAGMFAVDPADYQTAQKLGFELPADVVSNNPQVTGAMGLARSARGSEAQSTWEDVMAKARDRADELMKPMGVVTENGNPSLPVISSNALHDLTQARDNAFGSAKVVFDKVDDLVPKTTVVELPATKKALTDITKEVGDQLYPEEKQLLETLTKGQLTYGGFMRIKNGLGEAVSGQGPYANLKGASAKRLYAALKDDQIYNVEKLGSPELSQALQDANATYKKGKDLEDTIVTGFRGDEQGGIGGKLMAALNPVSLKKDASQFNAAMAVVPDDLKGQAVATAMAAMSRMKAGDKTVFSPKGFVDMYDGLLTNKAVYSQIFGSAGKAGLLPDGSKDVMQGLYDVSKRIVRANDALRPNGASLQLGVAMDKPNLGEAILEGSLRAGAASVGAGVGNAVLPGAGGLAGGIAGSGFADALIKSRPTTVQKMAKLFTSEKFQKLAVDYALGRAKQEDVLRLSYSPEFAGLAEAIGLKGTPADKTKWLMARMATVENAKNAVPQAKTSKMSATALEQRYQGAP